MSFTITSFLLLFLSTQSLSQSLNVNLKLLPRKSWTTSEAKLIKQATVKSFELLADSSVANCAYRNSFRHKSKDKLRQRWGNQIPIINKSQKVSITIHKKDLGHKSILGAAQVGIAKLNRKLYTIENLEIYLNKDLISGHLSERDISLEDLWINTISHEIAHNLGHKHGHGHGWEEDYPGYFATEIGFCAMTAGEHGSDLGDRNLRRKWMQKFKK